jgi:hypothetical protein
MSRPYGVSVLLGGVNNDGPQLFNLECSGAFSKCKAKAIGAASEQVDKILIADDGYNPSGPWTRRRSKCCVCSRRWAKAGRLALGTLDSPLMRFLLPIL